jgi:NAD(P)-dependent dehydrogenase (short-subunit alcohol dehydrogenase family)
MQNPLDMQGRLVIVTGGARGVGAGITRSFLEAGADVVVIGRSAPETPASSGAREAGFQAADVRDPEQVSAAFAAIHASYGRIDVLVNNAGIGHKVSIEEDDLDTFRQAMELNVTALWHLSKLSSPSMIANGGGSIVNIASMLGHVGSTPIKQAHYCASKGAVVNLTREMALQWARKGVRVNALCPGWFPSEMTAGMDSDEGSQQFIRTNSPIPRMGAEHELDGALLLLATSAGTFMTGQSVIVDGGWTAR